MNPLHQTSTPTGPHADPGGTNMSFSSGNSQPLGTGERITIDVGMGRASAMRSQRKLGVGIRGFYATM